MAAGLGALAIDSASLYLERRQVQSAVDLAALAAVRDPSRALEIAQSLLVENGLAGGDRLAVIPGHYRPDPTLPAEARFSPGAAPVNAVRVTYRQPGRLFFARWQSPPMIAAGAVAAVTPQVSFSVGSRLARLDGGLINGLLNALLGTGLSLTLADYRALADAQVHMLDFLDALATQLRLTALTYDDILGASASRGQVARAIAQVVPSAEAFLVTLIANGAPTSPRMAISRLLQLGELGRLAVGSRPTGLDARLSALDLLVLNATTGGTSQLALGVNADVPGLVGIGTTLAIGEPAQLSPLGVGPQGTTVRTAQMRSRLLLQLLGSPALLGAGVSLPVHVEVAAAEASVASATCPEPGSPRGAATILARPGLVRAHIGERAGGSLADFERPASYREAALIDALLIRITGSAGLDVSPPQPVALAFSSDDIADGTVKTTGTRRILGSLTGSLLERLQIRVWPLSLSATALHTALAQLAGPAAGVADIVVDNALSVLGLGLGEADINVHGVTCTRPALVQ